MSCPTNRVHCCSAQDWAGADLTRDLSLCFSLASSEMQCEQRVARIATGEKLYGHCFVVAMAAVRNRFICRTSINTLKAAIRKSKNVLTNTP